MHSCPCLVLNTACEMVHQDQGGADSSVERSVYNDDRMKFVMAEGMRSAAIKHDATSTRELTIEEVLYVLS